MGVQGQNKWRKYVNGDFGTRLDMIVLSGDMRHKQPLRTRTRTTKL